MTDITLFATKEDSMRGDPVPGTRAVFVSESNLSGPPPRRVYIDPRVDLTKHVGGFPVGRIIRERQKTWGDQAEVHHL